MRLPLLLAFTNRQGSKGATVRVFEGIWIIDWLCNTRFKLTVNGSDLGEIKNGQRIEVSSKSHSDVQVQIIEPGDSPLVDCWINRL